MYQQESVPLTTGVSKFVMKRGDLPVGKVWSEVLHGVSSEFRVIHNVYLKDYDKVEKKTTDTSYIYNMHDDNMSGLKIDIRYSLEIRKTTSYSSNEYNAFFFSIYDLPRLKIGLDECMSWLLGEDDKNVFVYTDTNILYSVRSDVSFDIKKRGASGLFRFKPTIIEDTSGTKYASIALVTLKGVIGTMTPYEFAAFHQTLSGIIDNFYTASMMLANYGLTYLKEIK